jgi:hypothetical protein
MANGRAGSRRNNYQISRDAGSFLALPHSVLDAPNFQKLSANAKGLLLELGRQLGKDNNGRLLLSKAHLLPRGWKSSDMISKGKKELLDGGFIYETVMGHRPNKASWYAVTWCALDKLSGYDVGAVEGFVRSAYSRNVGLKKKVLIPYSGAGKSVTVPCNGIATGKSVPSGGAISPHLSCISSPQYGHHLEIPSQTELPN